jgi:hypothetical protein
MSGMDCPAEREDAVSRPNTFPVGARAISGTDCGAEREDAVSGTRTSAPERRRFLTHSTTSRFGLG